MPANTNSIVPDERPKWLTAEELIALVGDAPPDPENSKVLIFDPDLSGPQPDYPDNRVLRPGANGTERHLTTFHHLWSPPMELLIDADAGGSKLEERLTLATRLIGRWVAAGYLDDEYVIANITKWLNGWYPSVDGVKVMKAYEDGKTHKSKLISDHPDLGSDLPEWLVKGWLETDSLCEIFGPSGALKSFTTVDLGCSVAHGLDDWHGDPIRRTGPVLYLAAEGQRGIKRRIRAWKRAHGVDVIPDFKLYPRAVQVSDTVAWQEFVADAVDLMPVLIIIDTKAQVTADLNENSPEMNKAIKQFSRLREATGACVLIVHHTGHEKVERSRGWSGGYAALDTQIRCERPDKKAFRAKLTLTKQKDENDDAERVLVLKSIGLGFSDEDGDEVTSLVIVSSHKPLNIPQATPGDAETPLPPPGTQRDAYGVLLSYGAEGVSAEQVAIELDKTDTSVLKALQRLSRRVQPLAREEGGRWFPRP